MATSPETEKALWTITLPQEEFSAQVNAWFEAGVEPKEIVAVIELGYLRLAKPVAPSLELVAGAIAKKVSSALKLEESADLSDRALASSKIGERGEAFVREILATVGGLTCEPHCGDIHAHFQGEDPVGNFVLVEVKNYKNSVPSSELTKFARDCSDCSASAGLFVSLGAPIAKTPDWHIEWRRCRGKKIPCVYVNTTQKKDIAHAYRLCVELAKNGTYDACAEDTAPAAATMKTLQNSLRVLRHANDKIRDSMRAAEEELIAGIVMLKEQAEHSEKIPDARIKAPR